LSPVHAHWTRAARTVVILVPFEPAFGGDAK